MDASKRRCLQHLIAIPLGVAVASVGVDHFFHPEIYDAIVPEYLGTPRLWTLSSGALEVSLGLGMTLPKTRDLSARLFGLLVLLMSLANLNMWWNDLEFNGTRLSGTGHLIRLTLQLLLLYTLYWLSRQDSAEKASK